MGGAEVGGKLTTLGAILTESMAKAFPVGFMGLVLMFIFHFVVSFPERKLRQILAERIALVLKKRQECCKSQGQIVSNAKDAIEKALEPLKDLKETMSEGIKPLVADFSKHLDDELKTLRAHFDSLNGIAQSLQEASTSTAENARVMKSAMKNMQRLVEDTPRIIDGLVVLFDAANEELKAMTTSFGAIYEQMIDTSAGISENIRTWQSTFSVWEEKIGEAMKQEQFESRRMIEGYVAINSTHLANMAERVEEVWKKWDEYPNQLNVVMSQIAEQFNKLPTSIQTLFDNLGESIDTKSISIWEKKTEELLEKYRETTNAHSQAMKEMIPQLQNGADAWKEVPKEIAREFSTRIDNIGQEGLQAWGSAIQKTFGEFSEKIHSLEEEMNRAILAINTQAKSWEELPEKMDESVRQILERSGIQIADTWKSKLDKLLSDLYNAYGIAIEDMKHNCSDIGGQTKGFQDDFSSLVGGIREQISSIIGSLKAEVKENLINLDNAFHQRIPNVLDSLSRVEKDISAMTRVMAEYTATLEEWLKNVKEANSAFAERAEKRKPRKKKKILTTEAEKTIGEKEKPPPRKSVLNTIMRLWRGSKK